VTARPGLWILAILAVAANLRPVITSLPPLVDQIAAGYGLSATAAGALTTLPVVCMGLFAPAAAPLAGRFGESAVLAVAVAVLAAGAGLRAVGGLVGLYGGTALAGIGIAVAGTLLPSLVRARVPDRIGPVTGLYTAVLIGGAFLAAGLTEPVRGALGVPPQVVLAVWALPAVLALVLWMALVHRRAGGVPSGRVGFPWRSGMAWLGTLFMGLQSLLFYATLAWLAVSYTELGVSTRGAGLLLALFSATQIVTALAMPALAHRTGDIRPWIAVSVGLTTVALALVAAVPYAAAAMPWVWAGLLGLGMGGNLSLALVVLTRMAPSPAAAAAYTGMAFFVGYLLAALGPVAAGALRDATGGFTAVYATLAVLGVITLAVGLASAGSRQDPRDHELSVVIPRRS
jgi:CP family cyanate transporter-like MFS transporter